LFVLVRIIFSPYRASNNQESQIRFSDTDQFQFYDGGGASDYPHLKTTRVFRDTNAWYHIVLAVDTTQGTAADRINIYVNGVKETAFAIEVYGDQSKALGYMGAQANYIGAYGYDSGGSVFYNGYLAEMHWVDGTQLTAASFGKTDTITGAWIPKEYTGSHGSQGWYLNFSDNSNTTAGTLGADSSANSNNWTPTNFSIAASPDNDSVLDTPTNNYCTLNPLDMKGDSTSASSTNGNLQTSTSDQSGHHNFWSTHGLTSGKWYCEGKIIGGSNTGANVMLRLLDHGPIDHNKDVSSWTGSGTAPQPYKAYNYGFKWGNLYHGNSTGNLLDYLPDAAVGDTWMMAFDLDAGKIWFGRNGTWGNNGSGTGDPAAGTYPAWDNINSATGQAGETWCVGGMDYGTGNVSFNFGQQGFVHTRPTGFNDICTANMPDTTIKDGTKHFNVVLHTANATAGKTVTGVGFSPNIFWSARRNATGASAGIFDSVRGVGKALNTAYNNAYETEDGVTSFDADGVTLGATWPNAANNDSWVDWAWKGGTAGSGSTTGSGTGKTYASNYNSPAGLSITRYTGNGTAGHTIPHSLGVAPEMIIIKAEENSGYWAVYHHKAFESAADPNILYLNVDAAEADDTNVFGTSVTINSSVFSLGDYTGSNTNDEDHIAYCFASVEGYCKVGEYYGNGNDDGTFVYTGFKPAAVIVKRTDTAEDWWMWDSTRNPGNPIDKNVYINSNVAEADEDCSDFLSNGFKLRLNNVNWNADDGNYIYIAFAETPFKYANAR